VNEARIGPISPNLCKYMQP